MSRTRIACVLFLHLILLGCVGWVLARPKTTSGAKRIVNPDDRVVELEAVLRKKGFRCARRCGTLKKTTLSFHKGGFQCAFTANSKEMIVNGTKVHLSRAIVEDKRHRLSTNGLDWERCICPLLFPTSIQPKPNPIVVVLDPGHGGSANGAEAGKVLEKDLTLQTVLILRTKLVDRGFRVFLTRDKDVDVSLEARPQLAQDVGAHLFVSIHYNSSPKKEPCGIETYLCSLHNRPSTGRDVPNSDDLERHPANQFDAQSVKLAFDVQSRLWQTLNRCDRGVKYARFVVIRGLNCPGILIECGFMSNPDELTLVNAEDYRRRLADAIVAAVEDYCSDRYGTTIRSEPSKPKIAEAKKTKKTANKKARPTRRKD